MPEKNKPSRKQGPPVQFRPGSQLERIMLDFARKHSIKTNEACKVLVALAVNELDCRFYSMVAKMAKAVGGTNGFIEACTRIHSQLEGARRATSDPMQLDPKRAVFIQDTVIEYLKGAGHAVDGLQLEFLSREQAETSSKSESHEPRKVRRKVQSGIAEMFHPTITGAVDNDEQETEEKQRAQAEKC